MEKREIKIGRERTLKPEKPREDQTTLKKKEP
jgi:hypothetical protein